MKRIKMPENLPRPVVLLSHRAPVAFRRSADGKRTARRGAGGLVTALTDLSTQLEDVRWVCAAGGGEDVAVAAEHPGEPVPVALTAQPRVVSRDSTEDSVVPLRFVDVPEDQHERFYGVISNPLLWFIQHGLYGANSPDLGDAEHHAFSEGYVPVNEAFADAVAEEVEAAGGSALVMLHDYHFYLVAERVRKRCPDALISQFIHIPWPGPDSWRLLPPSMRERLLHGLLGNDVVAFHTEGSARRFLLSAQELLGLRVDLDTLTVEVDGRTVRARYYPISIDVASLRELASSKAVVDRIEDLSQNLAHGECQLILRVDRTDPSKNIVRGFAAFGLMLEDHPELAGKVRFLALLQPSRLDVPEYAAYLSAIAAQVARINARYDHLDYEPIDLRLIQDLPLAVAAYSACDVLMVNAVVDGMNLVAKEAVVVNRRDAVLVLSENTGAHQELGDYAVTVYPYDIRQQADALYEALTRPREQRRANLRDAAGVIERNDIAAWFSAQLADLAR
ncbi:MAG: trehalose-6-phosphate synthase [Actinomycetota bacterium]|nr:trehalose-6-phosphate synthase [Actinomycetota bacterium]